ncbi:MAG: hypothetical protein V1911_03710 [Candidatus Micrarchaeota archaeon]
MGLKKLVYRAINKKTPEEKLKRRIEIIQELIAQHALPEPKEPKQYAKNLATNFYLDSIVVSKKDGTIVMSTDGNSFDKAVKATSFCEYVKTNYPGTKFMTMKGNGKYDVLYNDGDLVFMFRSPGDISISETKRIAEQVRTGMEKYAIK